MAMNQQEREQQPVQPPAQPEPQRISRRDVLKWIGGLAGLGVAGGGAWAIFGRGNEQRPVAGSAPKEQTPTLGAKAAETPKPAVTASSTSTPEVKVQVRTLPKPAAWDYEPTINLVKAGSVPSFPKSAAEAAATFGVDPDTRNPARWEKTEEGDGWHLKETGEALNVNPRGYLMEGYYDTVPGHNAFAWAMVDIDGNIPAQGGTFWNEKGREQAVKLQKEMYTPKWRDAQGTVKEMPAEIISPN